MVLKIGIEQITRKDWEWTPYNENWISADYVNDGPPDETTKIPKGSKKFNYGFNDFMVVECTPEYAYQVHGALESDVELPPEHVRAYRRKTPGNKDYRHVQRLCLRNFEAQVRSTVNKYCDVEGPDSAEMYGDVFVKLIPLMIPGGLNSDRNDMFWIDLNKGVRALYFPARYQYSDDFPNDAAYAKISFVEDSARSLIDASQLFDGNELSKALIDSPLDLSNINRKTEGTIALNKAYHIGAYSFDSSLMVNVPNAKPHDAVYLAKSAQIAATRLPLSKTWALPGEFYWWTARTKELMRTYSGENPRSDQINLQEASTSDIGAGTEFFVSLLLNAASLIPYVGPLVSTLGAQVLDNMKDLRTDSTEQQAEAAGISGKVWNSIPGEAKDNLVAKLVPCAKMLISLGRR
ncbi:MAG: hypothetical protein Q9169_002117 [Polycauliona sp. 2 TL-2023]